MQTYLLSEGMSYRTLVYNGVSIQFSIIGKALAMQKYDITRPHSGSLNTVNVVSLLEEQGVNEAEVAVCFDNFEVIGNVKGEELSKLRDILDSTKACFFVGRLNSKVKDINYKQTFYIFRQNQFNKDDFNKLMSVGE